MTLFFGLVRHQCRVLAVVGMAGLTVALLIGLMAEFAAGADPADVLRPAALASLAIVLLPEVLQVALPVSLAHAILTLEEGGELRAMCSTGVRPVFVAAALSCPLLPFVVALHPLVHSARPAALADARLAAVGSSGALLRGMTRLGVGVATDAEELRVLLPVGDAALAAIARRNAVAPGSLGLADGRVRVVDADGEQQQLRFTTAELRIAMPRPGLDAHSEKELSTRFLERSSMRWRRSRLDWGSARSGELVRRELNRRDLAVPSAIAALALCLGLVFVRRTLGVVAVHGLCTPIAVATSLFLARWLA